MVASNRVNNLFFGLAIISGLIIFQPDLIYQSIFFQGDHGRDLLAFSMTAKGFLPYRDFFWDYGPLPLYYFALFFKFFGESIRIVLLAEVCLKLVAGMAVFMILRPLRSPLWSYLGSVFFMSFFPYFYHTYSHGLGIVLLLFVIYFLVSYIDEPRDSCLFGGLAVVFLISLVKFTLAIVTLLSCAIALVVIHRVLKPAYRPRIFFYFAAFLILPAASFLVYLLYMFSLPPQILQHIFYYSAGSKDFFNSFFVTFGWLFRYLFLYAADHWRNPIIIGLLAASLCGLLLSLRKMESGERKKIGLTVFVLIFFYVTHIHEYLFTGLYHRLFWGAPFLILLLFFCLTTLAGRNRAVGVAAVMILTMLILSRVDHKYSSFKRHLSPDYYLETTKARVFLGNPRSWVDTVEETLDLLQSQVKGYETFLCVPYDSVYYFLLDQPSPVYPVAFFDFMRISPKLEADVIAGMDSKRVNWVVLSNRIYSDEEGLGIFGKTNSKKIGEYIDGHFDTYREFGDWSNPPGITSNYAVRILKRFR